VLGAAKKLSDDNATQLCVVITLACTRSITTHIVQARLDCFTLSLYVGAVLFRSPMRY
jgi:hypothetical protein